MNECITKFMLMRQDIRDMLVRFFDGRMLASQCKPRIAKQFFLECLEFRTTIVASFK